MTYSQTLSNHYWISLNRSTLFIFVCTPNIEERNRKRKNKNKIIRSLVLHVCEPQANFDGADQCSFAIRSCTHTRIHLGYDVNESFIIPDEKETETFASISCVWRDSYLNLFAEIFRKMQINNLIVEMFCFSSAIRFRAANGNATRSQFPRLNEDQSWQISIRLWNGRRTYFYKSKIIMNYYYYFCFDSPLCWIRCVTEALVQHRGIGLHYSVHN